MIARVYLATVSLGLLVLETTNREGVVLIAVNQARIDVAEVQVHVDRELAMALSRTPEVCVVAIADEIAIVAPAASRQGGKSESIIEYCTVPKRAERTAPAASAADTTGFHSSMSA